MDNASEDLNKDLMKELECPVCLEYMKPPISMCGNGHSICSDCKSKLNNCPVCRKSFLKVRNFALESLSTVLITADFTSKNLEPSNKSYKCPFTSISEEDCSWIGSLTDMKSHMKTSHNDGNDMHECGRRFNVVLTNLSPERHYRKVVCIADELFYVVWKLTDGSFFCAVLCVGSKKKSSKFVYKFSLTTENGKKEISMRFQTRSVVLEMQQIFTPGECVVLHYDTVLKFLNSDKCLFCDFEISPIETALAVGKNPSKSDQSKTDGIESYHSTVKREYLGEQTSPPKREFLDPRDDLPHRSYASGRPNRHRGGRARRRGVRDRSVEPHFHNESGVRDFQNRGGFFGKKSIMGRSLTDLRDVTHYIDKETVTVVKARDAVALRINPSSTFSAAKAESNDQLTDVSALGKTRDKFQGSEQTVNSSSSMATAEGSPSGQLTTVSTLEKSQDKVRAGDHKVISSSSLLTAKGVKGEQLTKVSTLEKSQDNFQECDKKVNFTSSLITAGVSAGQPIDVSTLEKSQDNFQAHHHELNSSSISVSAKGVRGEQLTKVSTLEKSQEKFQASDKKFISSSVLPLTKGMSSNECTNLTDLGKLQDKVRSIYPKLFSSDPSPVEYHQMTNISPFDTLHDLVQASNYKVSSNARVARNTSRDQSADFSPNAIPADNRSNTSISSEETWKCLLCGQLAPKKQMNDFSLIDVPLAGTTWKCKVCCQWRA
jgi:E3 ubiquitin-protein ligase SIAH1